MLLPSSSPNRLFREELCTQTVLMGQESISASSRNQAEFAVISEMMILNKESLYFWNSAPTPTGMIVFWEQPILKFQENRFWKFSEIKDNHYIIDYEKEIHHRVMLVGICVLFINALSSPIYNCIKFWICIFSICSRRILTFFKNNSLSAII